MLHLKITTTQAQIGINPGRPKQSIQQPKASQEIDQTWPVTKVDLKLPRVKIDQSQCFSESGLKGPLELTRENASYSVSKMYESVGRIVSQGNDMTNIQEGSDQIASQALYNAYDQFAVEFNMATMPTSRPKITVDEGQNLTKIEGAPVKHESKINKPIHEYTPAKVEIYMRQMNSIKIEVEGSQFDKTV